MRELDIPRSRKGHLPSAGSQFRLAAALSMAGFVLFVTMTFLHPGGPANDHRVIFEQYAASDGWQALHIGQFTGLALLVAGLLALHHALNIENGRGAWSARLGAVSAAMALGLYGVLQAVDGVALKHAVDSWARAPEVESDPRFATAEAVRWIEWGARSYQTLMLGLALVSLGTAITMSAKLPKLLGHVMVLSGLTYICQGWVLGVEGFSEVNTVAILAGYALVSVWLVWLAVVAWRLQSQKATDPSDLRSQ